MLSNELYIGICIALVILIVAYFANGHMSYHRYGNRYDQHHTERRHKADESQDGDCGCPLKKLRQQRDANLFKQHDQQAPRLLIERDLMEEEYKPKNKKKKPIISEGNIDKDALKLLYEQGETLLPEDNTAQAPQDWMEEIKYKNVTKDVLVNHNKYVRDANRMSKQPTMRQGTLDIPYVNYHGIGPRSKIRVDSSRPTIYSINDEDLYNGADGWNLKIG